jgi:hypothetical protein
MTEPRIPDITLERYRLRELPAADAARLDDLVAREPELQARLAALEQSDAEIRKGGVIRPPTVPVPAPFHRSRARWLIPVVAGLAAALLITIVTPRTAERSIDRSDDRRDNRSDDRIKGARPALALYRRTAAGSESLADGAVARPGDLVRVGYRAAGHAYGVIFSIDGRGNLTMHLPIAGDRAAPLGRDATVLLDAAYELDDAPLWERFYFVTGDTPFGVTPVVDAVRHAAALPKGLVQSTFSLQKEARP